jgi:quercetin dioxygenase-like cupin family protein
MEVVDGVAPMVLVVPAKGRETHAHIHPGDDHSGDGGVDVSKDTALQDGQIIQIPRFSGLGVIGVRDEA